MFDDFENKENNEEVNSASAEESAVEEATEQPVVEDVNSSSEQPAGTSAEGEEIPDFEIEIQDSEEPVQEDNEPPCVETEKVEHNDAGYGRPFNQQSYQNNSYNYQPYQQPGFNNVTPDDNNNKNERNKKGAKIFLAAVAIIIVFALGAGVGTFFKSKNDNNTTKDDSTVTGDTAELEIVEAPKESKKSSKVSDGSVLTPAQIAEKVRASNVGIVVYSGDNSTETAGEGSGVVMGEDSTGKYTYVITCAHVIDTAGIKCTVQTENGDSFDADIVGYDTRTDLGVLKVHTTGLEAAEFGDSDALSIGDPVYAVGNPGGVEFFGSFTGGYISAINRPVSSEIGYTMKCIQHDASINPGNSGGMLVNQYGQVVGINSQKIADTSYEGMGFAIPITSAKEVIDSLIKYSYVPNRPKLGITYYPVSASTQYNMIAQIKGLPAGTLIINEISSDSALAGTDARKYDMIIAVNGKELTTADVLLELIDNGKVGDKITLTLCRVNSNYSIDEFDVEATLVEDKGEPETTTATALNPFDYFYDNYGY